MRILFSTCSGANYMAPPQLADEQINCGPFFQNREVAGRVVSLATPKGEYDLHSVASRLPADQQPDAVVCLVDASWFNTPKNLASFKCPKIALIADTHHMNKPITGMINYLRSQPYDRHIFLYTRHHAEFFREAGIKNLFWFPGLTFPHGDRVVQSVRAAERSNRIALIGQAGNLHKRRQKLAGALAAAHLPLVFREAPQREALDFYGNSLVGFNASANGDLNLRVLEIISTGAMLLTDRLAPDSGLDLLLKDGSELVGYDSAEELVERARHYTTHPDEAHRIGAAGAQWFDTYFNEQRRRADFAAIAFDGRAAPQFPLSAPRKAWLDCFGNNAPHFASAISAYEHLQQLHSTNEQLTIHADASVPAGFKLMCDTLPRLHVVSQLRPNTGADCLALSTQAALKLKTLEAPRLWCWDAAGAPAAEVAARLRGAGLAQVGDLPFFEVPEPSAPKERLATEAKRLLFHCDLQNAVDYARRALQENPRSLEATLVMAELALEGGKAELFAKMISKAREIAPDDPRIPLLELSARTPASRQRPAERLLTVALRHVSGNDLTQARLVAQRALRLDATLAAAHFWIGQISLTLAKTAGAANREQETALALRHLRQAAELAPHRAAYWLELAQSLRAVGLLAQAADAFARVVDIDGGDPVVCLHGTQVLLELSQPERAAALAEAGLARAPGHRALRLALAQALMRQHRFDEARAAYRVAFGGAEETGADESERRVIFVAESDRGRDRFAPAFAAFAADESWETLWCGPAAPTDTAGRDWRSFAPRRGDVVFHHEGSDRNRPVPWRIGSLVAAGAQTVFWPTDLPASDLADGEAATVSGLAAQTASLVLVASETTRRVFAEDCPCGDAHVALAPSVARGEISTVVDEELRCVAAGRKLVAWAAADDVRLAESPFGEGRSTFLRWHRTMAQEMARRSDLAFVVCVPAELSRRLEETGAMLPGEFTGFLDELARLPNVRLRHAAQIGAALCTADALIADASVELVDFAAQGRPVLYLFNPHGPTPLGELEMLRQLGAAARRAQEIGEFLSAVAAGRPLPTPLLNSRARVASHGEAGLHVKQLVETRLASVLAAPRELQLSA